MGDFREMAEVAAIFGCRKKFQTLRICSYFKSLLKLLTKSRNRNISCI